MQWIDELVQTYFQKTAPRRASYSNFLSRSETYILEHAVDLVSFETLDDQLYRRFKASLPKDAPSTSLRRLGTTSFWRDARQKFQQNHLKEKQADVANEFEESATDLLNKARTAAASAIGNNLSNRKRKRKRNRGVKVQYHDSQLHSRQQQVLTEDPFVDATPEDRTRSAIINFMSKEQHVAEIHKQDLLYYGIIDRIPTSATKLREEVASDDLDQIIKAADSCTTRKILDETDGSQDDVKAFVEDIIQPVVDVPSLREAIKTANHLAKANTDVSRIWQKKVVKLLKEVRDVYTDDGNSLLLQDQGEMNYISTFLAPIIKKLFKGYDEISYKWGDTALTASKEEERAAQKDNEIRSRGKAPDGIFHLVGYGTDIALLEVSGPPNAANHQHYVGDRNKLAKALKQLLKKIRRTVSDGDTNLYQNIALYGIQIYMHTLYIYSLREPVRGIYVFDQEASFSISCPIGMVPSFLPKFIRKLWKLKCFLLGSSLAVKDYLNSDTGADSSDLSDDSRDTVYISPIKKGKRK